MDGNVIELDSGVVQSDWTQTDDTAPDYIKNKMQVISATVTSPSLPELQALVDKDVNVFYGNSIAGAPTLPSGQLNLKDKTYYFIGGFEEFSGFSVSGDTVFNFLSPTGANTVCFKGLLSIGAGASFSITNSNTLPTFQKIIVGDNSSIITGSDFHVETIDTLSQTPITLLITGYIRYQYLGENILFGGGGSAVQSDWVRPETGDLQVKTLELDTQGKTISDRIMTVVDKSTSEVFGSIRGDGSILWGQQAVMADLLVGLLEIVTQLTVDGITNMGSPTESNGTLNVKAIQTGFSGYSLIVPAGSDTVGNYGISASTSIDYPSDPVYEYTGSNDTYYLYSGEISDRKYWFVGVEIFTGTTAFTNCQFRHTAPSGSSQADQDAWIPEDSAFIGINAPDSSNPASAIFLSGVAGPSANFDGDVHMHNIPTGLPAGKTKLGNIAIATDGSLYVE